MYSKIFMFLWLLVPLWIGSSVAEVTESKKTNAIDANDAIIKANSTISQAEDQLKKKCEKNVDTDWEAKFHRVQAARVKLEECGKTFINITEVQKDMEKFRPEGKLDEVFKKYCDKKGNLTKCVKEYTNELQGCLSKKERQHIPTFHNVTEQLVNFICHKDGDRIALFIAEGGPECLTNHTEDIQHCVQNSTKASGTSIDPENISVTDLSQFDLEFSNESCQDMLKLKECVVARLALCPQQTPSNIADALFKFVYKATPCSQSVSSQSKKSSASQISTVVSTLSAALLALALL